MKREILPVRKGLERIFECVPKATVCEIVGKSRPWMSQRLGRAVNPNGNTYYFSRKDVDALNAAIATLITTIRVISLPLNQKSDPVAFRDAMEYTIKYVKSSWLAEGLRLRRSEWHNYLTEKDTRYWFSNQDIAHLQDMLSEVAEMLESVELQFEELEKKQ